MLNKKKSIKTRLTNLISFSLALILSVLFIMIDFNMDDWAESQYLSEVKSQSYIIRSFISMNNKQHPLIDKNDILTSNDNDQVFYQIWVNDKSIEKSDNLTQYPSLDLIKYDIPLHSNRIIDIKLPNGEDGVAALNKFTIVDNGPVYYVTLYNSKQKLNRVLYTLDIALVLSFIITLFLTRILSFKIANRGLKPLLDLNSDINTVTKHPLTLLPNNYQNTIEISPIYNSINNYIIKNNELINNEKRITSDIAHELKTPISEIMALTEVYSKFPDDPRIAETYVDDVLKISHEMNHLINELLSLQHIKKQSDEDIIQPVDLNELINSVINKLNICFDDVHIQPKTQANPILCNYTAISIALRNLVDNANFYKKAQSKIAIAIKNYHSSSVILIKNKIEQRIPEEELANLTKPLFKMDKVRKNNQHYGLGLTIVERICEEHGYELFIFQDSELNFCACLKINTHQNQLNNL